MAEVTHDSRPTLPIVQFKRDIENMVARELDMLDDKAKSRMKSAAIVAVGKDPGLLVADRQSFMMAIRMCASHGVVPDGNEATLQTYDTKVKRADGKEEWVKKVTYLPMVRGIINRVQRSGKIRIFYAEVVCEGEQFTLDLSHGDRRPVHVFNPMLRSKNILGAYSVATYDDGTVDTEPMPMAEIAKVRAVAKTDKVWSAWESEKCKVAVLKRHSKRLPLSAEDMDFILNREETDFEQARDVTPKESPLAQFVKQERAAQIDQKPVEAVAPHWTESIAWADAFPGSAAWDQGSEAFASGKPSTDCPYDGDTDVARAEASAWLGGWHGARRAAE